MDIESKEFLKMYPNAVVLLDDAGTIIDSNAPFRKLLNLDPSEALGPGILDLLQDRGGFGEVLPRILRGETVRRTVTLVLNGETTRVVRLAACRLQSDPAVSIVSMDEVADVADPSERLLLEQASLC